MREARAHLELKGQLTGELNREAAQAIPQHTLIIVPARVPAGAPANLHATLPPIPEALRLEPGMHVIDVEAEDLEAGQSGERPG
jgi:hypothetical protein